MAKKRIISSMELQKIVLERRDTLSCAERRIAEAVLREPEHVAFGTLAEVASRTGASGTTVLRLATKLGFEGFGALQTHVQDDLARRLRPARQRLRAAGSQDTLRGAGAGDRQPPDHLRRPRPRRVPCGRGALGTLSGPR